MMTSMALDSVKIASVHFWPVTMARRYRGKPYEIPAVALNAPPAILTVRPLMEFDDGPVTSGPGGGKRQKLSYPVMPIHIAHDIVGHWTGHLIGGGGMNPSCHPGIWVVREKIPMIVQKQEIVSGETLTHEERMMLDSEGNNAFRDATSEEREEMWQEDLNQARAADRAYAEWCWNEGNRIFQAWQHGSKEPVPRAMPPMYKAAAKHYGLEAEWLKEAAAIDAVQCGVCGRMGTKNSFMCQCGEPLDVERWAAWKAKKDLAMKTAEANLRKPLAPPVVAPSSQVSA